MCMYLRASSAFNLSRIVFVVYRGENRNTLGIYIHMYTNEYEKHDFLYFCKVNVHVKCVLKLVNNRKSYIF